MSGVQPAQPDGVSGARPGTRWSSGVDRRARRRATGSPRPGTACSWSRRSASPREDLRRRPHAPRRPPAPRHGSRRQLSRLAPLRRPALDRARRHPRARVARPSRLPRLTGTWCAGATSTRWSPTPPPTPERRCGRAPRRVEPLVEDGLVTGAVIRRDGATEPVRARYVVVADGANSRFGRALGTARDRTYPLGHGGAGLLHQPVPRRAVDREPPRPPRPRRQPPARLRLDLPRRRRHRERRRRPAVDVLGLEGRSTPAC